MTSPEPLGAPGPAPAAPAQAARGPLPEAVEPPEDAAGRQTDGISLSERTRALLARLQPVLVRVRCFWDHALRRVQLGGGAELEVDPAGGYRLRRPGTAATLA